MTIKKFDEVFEDKTKCGTKIKTDEYHASGAHLIVDQGQAKVAGYTDLEQGLFEDVPAVIFGDHTRVIKYIEEPFFLGADGVKVLKSKLPEANYKYLYYALKHASIPNTGYNRHFKWLKEIQIAYPDTAEQASVVQVLDTVDAIIEARQCELQRLDELVKARFVEMFGNPFTESSFEEKKLMEISTSIADGSNVDKAYYADNGDILFLRIQNVWFNEFRLDDSVFISDEVNRQYFDTSLHHGDLLITKIGRYYTSDSSLGRVSVYLGEDNRANYSNNIMRVRLAEGIHSEFVNALMNLDDYNKHIRRVSVGGTDKRALSKAIIGDLPIIVPPYALQMQFVDFVHQVDKSKVVVQGALDKAQHLFDSLMQQYFG